jgi:hypothetical protein
MLRYWLRQQLIFSKARPELWFCVNTAADAKKFRSNVNKELITELGIA